MQKKRNRKAGRWVSRRWESSRGTGDRSSDGKILSSGRAGGRGHWQILIRVRRILANMRFMRKVLAKRQLERQTGAPC